MSVQIQLCHKIGADEACLLLLADPSWEKIQCYLHRGNCLVLKHGHKTVGIVVIVPKQEGVMEIANLAVHPSLQGNGYGRILVNAAIDHARVNGATSVVVSTGNSSMGPLALYQACGFIISRVDKDYFLRHYDEPIYENGVQCRDQINLSLSL